MIDDFRRVDDVILQRHRPVGEELDVLGGARHDAVQIAGEQRAVVHGLDRREILGARLQAFRETLEDGQTPFRTQRGPGRKGLARRIDRRADLGPGPRSDIAEMRAIDRRDVGEAIRGRNAAAADPVIGRYLDARDDGCVVGHFLPS